MSSHGIRPLATAGLRCVRDSLGGRSALPAGWAPFGAALARSMRPHYFAIPAGACLAGAAAAARVEEPWRVGLATTAAALGWGVGQLLNDLLDVEADSVAAPLRPSVRGLLPPGPTFLVAVALGGLVAAMTAVVHRHSWWFALLAAGLLVGYGAAKRWPLAGNLAHGALVATSAAIGALAAAPALSLSEALAPVGPTCLLTGGWAAVYLEANYEKDRTSDTFGRCRTLAHVVGLRASALLRFGFGSSLMAAATAEDPAGWPALLAAWVLLGASCVPVLRTPTDAAALRGYRFAVHAAATGMLAMASPVCGATLSWIGIAGCALVTERAFAIDPRSS